jgi:plasmid stabilization system protein ParE
LYIAADSAAYAAAVVKTILQTARNLSQFPHSGRVVPEIADESIREWFAYSYRVIYRIEAEERITIAAIVHGRRLLDL